MPTCVGGTAADGTTNSLSLIMRSWTSDFGHSAQVTSLVDRISPGLMVRDGDQHVRDALWLFLLDDDRVRLLFEEHFDQKRRGASENEGDDGEHDD